MKKAILATKVGMTQIFNEDGVLTPVTVLQAGPCVVTQVKTVENDGYDAVQVGFADIREKLVNKPVKGHFDTRLMNCLMPRPAQVQNEFWSRYEKDPQEAPRWSSSRKSTSTALA